MRDPSYSLKQYYSDVRAAFPELKLYMVERAARDTPGSSAVSSGVSVRVCMYACACACV